MKIIRSAFWALALVTALTCSASSRAQEPGKSKDEALDSLIEKLAEPKPSVPPEQPGPQAKSEKKQGSTEKEVKPKKVGAADVATKDKELDELLEKLGETKDEPAAPDRGGQRPPPGQHGDEPSPPSPGSAGKTKEREKVPGLQGKDREIDERLEEFAGKKRKKNRGDQEQGNSPLGQIIKEMRDVEQKLGKPETGEDTQSKQKKIVKQIETMIEQVRQSSGSGSMAMRQVRQAGQKPGDQSGQTPGSTGAGAPATKPAKPSDRRTMPDGKDIWGHLPPELRQEMENVFKEDALPAKQDLIRRYYLSIAKQKLVRGE